MPVHSRAMAPMGQVGPPPRRLRYQIPNTGPIHSFIYSFIKGGLQAVMGQVLGPALPQTPLALEATAPLTHPPPAPHDVATAYPSSKPSMTPSHFQAKGQLFGLAPMGQSHHWHAQGS